MSRLADEVLPLIRTRADLHRWNVANAHGVQMQQAVARLQDAAPVEDPTVVLDVTQRAIAAALKVIMRADDSSGIIGDAVRGLLDLHPQVAARAKAPYPRLVDWMIRFQFDEDCDFFTLDPVAYAPALGDLGVAAYRARLDQQRAALGTPPPIGARWDSPHAHDWFTLDWNAQRLAVLDRDVEAIITTHARDRRVAAWLEDTSEALEEIGEVDLAIDWAKQATDFDHGHQSRKAADRWCRLLAEHRPDELLPARLEAFHRWPSSNTAAALHRDAGPAWPQYEPEVIEQLAASPRDAVLFTMLTLGDLPRAWALSHDLDLTDDQTWAELATRFEKVDPLAVLPVHARLVDHELAHTGAGHYRSAARRLARMRRTAAGTDHAPEVDALIADLRATHRRRPRLQQEFDRAGLP